MGRCVPGIVGERRTAKGAKPENTARLTALYAKAPRTVLANPPAAFWRGIR